MNNQINIIFLSGDFEHNHPDILTYNEELVNNIKNTVEKIKIANSLFASGYILGLELIHNFQIFNIILKKSGKI
jgi:hypothetical protein